MDNIVIQLLPSFAAAFFYAVLGFHFWNTRWREKNEPCIACPMQIWERAAIGVALLIHAFALSHTLITPLGIAFSFGYALSLMIWLAVLIYWIESFMARMEGMQPLVLPLAAFCTALPIFFQQTHLIAHTQTHGFYLHFLSAMLAYSLLTLAALHAIFMAFTERALHARSLKRSLATLPPLMTLESLLFRMIGLGFLLLTIAVGSGLFFSEAVFGKPLRFDHKSVFSIISWFIFAILLLGRHFSGWRGKRALHWTLTGFAILILAYIGTRFVTEVILQRI